MRLARFLSIAGALCGAASSAASAQGPGWTLSLSLAQSTDSRSATLPGSCAFACTGADVLAPMSLTMVEIELSRPISGRSAIGLEYHGRVVPVAYVRGNPVSAAQRSPQGWQMPSDTERSSTLGVGIEPVGLRLWIGSSTIRVEGDFAVGIIGFFEPLLAANATKANAVFEVGVAARVSRLVFGYRKHHLSNAGLGEVNPGLDSNLIFLGVYF
jgi:hypothetical protein